MIKLSKLLPSNILDTRWVDVIDVYQDLLYNSLIPEKIQHFQTKNIFELMTADELKEWIAVLGYPLISSEGYTSSIEFLRRQLQTIVHRIKCKTTWKVYQYLFYIYFMRGFTYPLLNLYGDGYLTVWVNWAETPLIEDMLIYLDTGRSLDESIIPKENWTLDAEGIINTVTRHFLFGYEFMYVENANEFLSYNTLRSFYNDVMQSKRAIEFPHFEPRITVTAVDKNVEYIIDLKTYEGTVVTNQKSARFQDDLSTVTKIQFGNGRRTNTLDGVNGCESPIVTLVFADDCDLLLQTATMIDVRKLLTPDGKLFDYSEVALFDDSDTCYMYSSFPTIAFFESMLASTYIKFRTVTS